MPGTGLPIPKDQEVLPHPSNVVGAGAYSTAQSWLNIAQSNRETAAAYEKIASAGAAIGSDAAQLYQQEQKQAQTAQIASFEVDWRAKNTEARDKYSGDPEGFKAWAESNTEGALAQVPGFMHTHAKQFLSREFDGTYATVLGEKRAQDKHLDAQSLVARTKMADDDVMSIASATGSLSSVEAKAAVATHQAVLDSAVSTGLMSGDHAQLLTEDLTTRAQSVVIRKSVEGVYRENGYEAARAHLDDLLQQYGAKLSVTDKLRTQTLGWLRSEEAGLRGERDAIGKEWAAAKTNLATLDPAVVQDIQNRAYGVGNMKVGDDIQAHTSALGIVKGLRQLPQADQIRVLATGNLDARLAQRESGGDPGVVNKLGYVGTYQFGAPRLADLGVYTPGAGENLAGWSKTPATAPGKWTGTFNIPGFPDVKTLQDFRDTPAAQKAVYTLHQQRTDQEIDKLGLGSFVGQTVGGVPITRDGIRAMVHIAGAEGTARTLTSGGAYNPADANGTTALDYARLGNSSDQPGAITGSRAGLLALGLLKKDMTQDLGRKITDLQAAINKTEFPPMDEIGALGAQVHLLGNEEQKRQVAEMAAQAEYGAKFTTLPADKRAEIIGAWNEKLRTGATQYERHLADTVRTADQHVSEEFKKDPYGAAYRFSEGFQALPAIDWSSPNVGAMLGAKAAQQNTIRTDQNVGAFSALRPGEASAVAAQLVNGDARQSKGIIDAMVANLPPDIYRATISDPAIRNALDGMVRSYDPNKLDLAMSTMDRAYRADPVGFKETFKDDTLRRLQTWQARKDYTPPIAMAEYFKRADDPAFATARAHLEKEADDKIAGLKPGQVANKLGSFADRWVPFVNQAPPVDPLTANALTGEYERLFKERYVDTQDVSKAEAQTVERLKTVWGPSTVADGALMRHPPERYYPQVDGSWDWMKRDLESSITASRLGAGTTTVNVPGVTPDIPGAPATAEVPAFSYRLLSDQRTEADVGAKRPPSYTVMVRDLASGRDTVPLDWAGNPMRFSFDPSNAQGVARERFTTRRDAMNELLGPGGGADFPSHDPVAPHWRNLPTGTEDRVVWTRPNPEVLPGDNIWYGPGVTRP